MDTEPALLLNRTEVEQLLSVPECIDAVERVFRLQGEDKIPPSGILGVKARDGGLHVKAGFLPGEKNYLVAKLNANFPMNPARLGLPAIQGMIVICDGENGSPLALLDSIDITLKRTAAASAVAAKFLARKDAAAATICGCGAQGRAQLRAIQSVCALQRVFAFDADLRASKTFAIELSRELKIDIRSVGALPEALRNSDVVVTCTPATKFFVHRKDVAAGTFVAAVGADDAHKQEIDPALMASSKIVADSVEQCCAIGDTHHAIAHGLTRKENVYAELGEIVAGRKPGRTGEDEIIIFDSTGIAVEDAAASVLVYEKARERGLGDRFEFAG